MREQNETREAELASLAEQGEHQAKELSGLRNRTTLSQQNFSKEREELLRREAYAKEEFETAKQAMQDWEILAMEERSIRESIAEKVVDLEEQVNSYREAHERAASERDSQSSTVDGLQRALQELQEGKHPCLLCAWNLTNVFQLDDANCGRWLKTLKLKSRASRSNFGKVKVEPQRLHQRSRLRVQNLTGRFLSKRRSRRKTCLSESCGMKQ